MATGGGGGSAADAEVDADLFELLSRMISPERKIQRCKSFTEKIVVAKFSGKVMHSGIVMLDCTLILWKRLAVTSMGQKTVPIIYQ